MHSTIDGGSLLRMSNPAASNFPFASIVTLVEDTNSFGTNAEGFRLVHDGLANKFFLQSANGAASTNDLTLERTRKNFGIWTSGNLAKLTVAANASFLSPGTVTVNVGSPTVTGVGTKFLTDFAEGDRIRVDATVPQETRTVTAIASDTSLTAAANWVAAAAGSTATNFPAILRLDNSAGTTALVVNSSGYLTVGGLGQGGRIRLSGADATADGVGAALEVINGSPGGDFWYLRAGATGNNTPAGGFSISSDANDYPFVITNTGKVGMGALAPATKLQVVGDIRVGTSGTNGCLQRFDAAPLTGVCSSDARLKKDIRPFDSLLDRFARLQPVSHLWRADEFPDFQFGANRVNGLIAQEVQQIFPELVSTDDKGFFRVNYSDLPLLTIQAVKELKQENDALKARLSQLESLMEERLGVQLSKVR